MTQSTRPRTLHQLMAAAAGLPMTHAELTVWRRRPERHRATAERALARALNRDDDRPLTADETRGLREMRVRRAARDRAAPPARDPRVELDADWYRLAVRRFERWARRAAALGLDPGRPPAHVRAMALAVVGMAQAEGGKS